MSAQEEEARALWFDHLERSCCLLGFASRSRLTGAYCWGLILFAIIRLFATIPLVQEGMVPQDFLITLALTLTYQCVILGVSS